ncbi:hypothetical protein K3495_g8868 [Podosphaera aphanis]|nr:hypothetical protein K3495_g8868 [Podosphaera aphanis]
MPGPKTQPQSQLQPQPQPQPQSEHEHEPESSIPSDRQKSERANPASLTGTDRILALRNLPTTRAPKRKRVANVSQDLDDERYRLLNIEFRIHMLRYHSWVNYGEAIDKIYNLGVADPTVDPNFKPTKNEYANHDAALWIQARSDIMSKVKDWKHYTIEKFENYMVAWNTENPSLSEMEMEQCRLELEARFNQTDFFSVYYYLQGYLDFEKTMKTHRKGAWFLKKSWCALGWEVQKYLNTGAKKNLNARKTLLDQFDLIPLAPIFKTIGLEHFARLQRDSKKHKGPRKPMDLTGINSLALGDDGPPLDDEVP